MDDYEKIGFISKLLQNWSDPIWWADNGSNYVIFSIIFGIVFSLVRYGINLLNTRGFKGWKLVLKGLKDAPEPQKIYWRDMERNMESPFEKWKFIKSAVSSVCWIKTPNIQTAENKWLAYGDKQIIIDFKKMNDDDTEMQELSKKLAS